MSFSDLFDSEFKQRNQGHFASIVRIALADGIFAPEEKTFLEKLAIKLEISEAEYETILSDPSRLPINPPYLNAQRNERLYDLARIVSIDNHLLDRKTIMMEKLCLGIGFVPEHVKAIVSKALSLVNEKVDSDSFIEQIEQLEKSLN